MSINKPKEIVALEKAAALNPDFAQLYGHYAMYVPEYSEMKRELEGKEINYGMSKRAAEEVAALAFGKDGNELSEKTLKHNVEIFVIRIRSKLQQLLANPEWMKAFELHERIEDVRLDAEQEIAELQGKPANLRRLVRERFQADLIDNKLDYSRNFDAATRNEKKMAAEVLSHPTERAILFQKSHVVEAMPIEKMVIDPAMITDTLLRNLGLQNYIAPKRSKKAVKLEMKALAIEPIREKLTDLRTIMAFEDDALAENYFRTFADRDGYLIGTTNILGRKRLFLTDLDAAVRRLAHIEDNQIDEIGKLRKIQNVIASADHKITHEWEQVKSSDELQKIKDDMLAIVKSLRYVNNKFKTELRALIEGCVTMESTFTKKVKDGKGGTKVEQVVRLNPGAKKAKFVSAKAKIGDRIKEIGHISQKMVQDRIRVESVWADHQEIPFEGLKKYIEERAAAPKVAGRGPVVSAEEKEELQAKIRHWREEFGAFKRGMVLQPYRAFAKKLGEKFNLVDSRLGVAAPERKEVAAAVAEMYMVVKLQRFWDGLQKIYVGQLVNRQMPYFAELEHELKGLKAMILKKTVAPGIKTPKFDDVFHMFYKLLDGLIVLAEEGRQAMKAKDNEKAFAVKGQMYKAISDIDIAKLVGGIE